MKFVENYTSVQAGGGGKEEKLNTALVINKKMQNKVIERDTWNKDKGRSCMMRKWRKYRPMFEDLYLSKSNLPVCTQSCLICNWCWSSKEIQMVAKHRIKQGSLWKTKKCYNRELISGMVKMQTLAETHNSSHPNFPRKTRIGTVTGSLKLVYVLEAQQSSLTIRRHVISMV